MKTSWYGLYGSGGRNLKGFGVVEGYVHRFAAALVACLVVVGCSTAPPSATTSTGAGLPGFPVPDWSTSSRSLAQAKRQYEAIVKADPQEKYAWYDLGLIAQGAHQTDVAAADWLRAIAIDHDFEAALYNYGVLQLDAGKPASAINYLQRAVAQNPKDATALWTLGSARARRRSKGDKAAALRDIHRALAMDPSLSNSRTTPR